MRIAIIGTGAMGCLFGSILSEAGHEVWMINPNETPVRIINNNGIKVEKGDIISIVKNVKATSKGETVGKVDLVVLTVKSGSTFQAISNSVPLIGENTIVLTLQNGVGNVEIISKVIGQSRIIAGVTGQASTLLNQGHIKHTGSGETIIGELNGTITPRAILISDIFNNAGIFTKVTNNTDGLIWGKLLVNVGINAITALTGLKNGDLLEYNEAEELLEMAVQEALLVVQKKGIKLEIDNPVEYTKKICQITRDNKSSMLQDILNNRLTEIDFINGAIVKEGNKLNIDTPVNKVLTNLVKIKDKTVDSNIS